MSSINTISGFTSGTSSSSTKAVNLSEETIAKLLALGIDIESVSSETEAKKLIEQAEDEKKGNSSDKDKNSKSDESLYDSLKSLANKIGITVSQNEDIEDIFDKISQKLDEFKENSYSTNYNVFQGEYEMLKLQFKNMNSPEASILSALDIMSQNNRAALGI
ncbi:MAG: hypothetical protein LUH11_03200 [Candidatus Gastranaerophilales bacterium]|nr:hypothetical protein [Candidatus Gastranaerophilales bacterium]